MADTPKLNPSDRSVEAYEKINQSIEHANEAKNESSQANTTADEAKQIAESSNTKSVRTQEQLDQVVIEGDSSVEAAQARVDTDGVSHQTLKERLDDEHTEVTTQLAEKSKEIFNKDLVNHKAQKPMITILDDDARNQLYDIIYPIIVDENIPVTSAVVTNRVETGNELTISKAQYDEMLSSGLVEFVSHTSNHVNLTDITLAEAEAELKDSQNWLKQNGGNSDYLVYPYQGHNKSIRNLTRKYYKAAFSTVNEVATPPVQMYNFARVDFERTFTQQQAWIDEAVANNTWVIFNTHSSYETFTAQGLRDLISYAKSVGIEFVTIEQGMASFANLLEVGDIEEDTHSVIDSRGDLHGYISPGYKQFASSSNITSETSVTEFKPESLSTFYFTVANGTGAGFPDGGRLFVDRRINDDYSTQTFYAYGSTDVYRRKWDSSSSTWGEFERLTPNSETVTLQVDSTIIPAQSSVNLSFASSLFEIGDNVIANPLFLLDAGLSYDVYVRSDVSNQVLLRINNITSTDVTLSTGDWKFTRFRL